MRDLLTVCRPESRAITGGKRKSCWIGESSLIAASVSLIYYHPVWRVGGTNFGANLFSRGPSHKRGANGSVTPRRRRRFSFISLLFFFFFYRFLWLHRRPSWAMRPIAVQMERDAAFSALPRALFSYYYSVSLSMTCLRFLFSSPTTRKPNSKAHLLPSALLLLVLLLCCSALPGNSFSSPGFNSRGTPVPQKLRREGERGERWRELMKSGPVSTLVGLGIEEKVVSSSSFFFFFPFCWLPLGVREYKRW